LDHLLEGHVQVPALRDRRPDGCGRAAWNRLASAARGGQNNRAQLVPGLQCLLFLPAIEQLDCSVMQIDNFFNSKRGILLWKIWGNSIADAILNITQNWLIDHILDEDSHYAKHVNQQPPA
jgi:hypothetical protein